MSVPAAMVISCVETSYLATMPTGSSTRSKIEASSFSGLFTLVEIGHIVIGPAGYGTNKSRGSGSSVLSHRSYDSGGMITGIRS